MPIDNDQNNNGFVDGRIDGVIFQPLIQHQDERGWLMELFRHDELESANHPRMAYISETLPDKSRGPHEHVEQSDLFAFIGPGDLTLYLWDPRADSPSSGCRQTVTVGESNKQLVTIPSGVVHGYKNTGDTTAVIHNFPNRLFAGEGKQHSIDEIRYENDPDCPYQFD